MVFLFHLCHQESSSVAILIEGCRCKERLLKFNPANWNCFAGLEEDRGTWFCKNFPVCPHSHDDETCLSKLILFQITRLLRKPNSKTISRSTNEDIFCLLQSLTSPLDPVLNQYAPTSVTCCPAFRYCPYVCLLWHFVSPRPCTTFRSV